VNYTFQPGFPRRRNDDGSYDSMCLECLQMVASRCPVTQLNRFEESHVCKARRTAYQPVSSSRAPLSSSSLPHLVATAR